MNNEITTHIGLLTITVFIASSQSLKDKRHVIKSLKDKVRLKFNVSVAELDGLDKWQVATLGFAMIGNDNRYVDSTLANIVSLIESHHEVQITDHRVEFV